MGKGTLSSRTYQQLTFEERESISIYKAEGMSESDIAGKLGRHKSTISRELTRNQPEKRPDVRYRATQADRRSRARKRVAHKKMRLPNPEVREYVETHLGIGWSPEQIAGRLHLERPELKTNYESIYQWIYAEKPELSEALPRGRGKRRKRGAAKNKHKTRIPDRRSIELRPSGINDRSEIGHWEADTLVSRSNSAALAVSVERVLKYTRISRLPEKCALSMSDAVADQLRVLPQELRRSISYDNGAENAQHQRTNRVLGTESYFCHPYHSWEKGTIENTNGLIRRYFPKGTDFAKVSERQVKAVERLLNTRPRKCHGFYTPQEMLDACCVALVG